MKLGFVFAAALVLMPVGAWAGGCSRSDLGPEIFCGTYREVPKTSFNTAPDGTFAKPQVFVSLTDLLGSLPSDSDMRSSGVDFHGGPATRLPSERVNVQVAAYVVAVKPGEGDHDYHVIISDRPLCAQPCDAVFMNAEVSGIPRSGDDARGDFARVRGEIATVVPETVGVSGSYVEIVDPRPVLVQGSVYFDADHRAGCASGCPGPAYARPTTVWEVHPIFHIEKASAGLLTTEAGTLRP